MMTHIHWPGESKVIQKLKSLHVIFSYTTIIIGCHEMHSTPGRLCSSDGVFYKKIKKIQINSFQKQERYPRLSYISTAFVMALSSYVVRVQKLTPSLSRRCSKRQTILYKSFNRAKVLLCHQLESVIIPITNKKSGQPEKTSIGSYHLM